MNDIIDARCGWAGSDELYIKYHDEEWGRPVTDDRTLFEFLVLESAQAGLSWITILRKREGYRTAFHHFDIQRVARMTSEDIDRLMQFGGIVRNPAEDCRRNRQRPAVHSHSARIRQFLRLRPLLLPRPTTGRPSLPKTGTGTRHIRRGGRPER